uniref:PDZ domain-containing protein n=1 Tax=Glossina pallidipes TaxID=7398 RepID=A0A1A9Z0X3_GLOPL
MGDLIMSMFKRYANIKDSGCLIPGHGGPLHNFLFSIILFWGIFMLGMPSYKIIIQDVIPNSEADQIGISANMEIKKINNIKVSDWSNVYENFKKDAILIRLTYPNSFITVEKKVKLKNTKSSLNYDDPIINFGIIPLIPNISTNIESIELNSPAMKYGLRKNDKIIRINNIEIQNSWYLLSYVLRNNPNKMLTMDIERNENIIQIKVLCGTKMLNGIKEGVINLIPIPVLDGGHILFLIVEKCLGSPIPKKIQIIRLEKVHEEHMLINLPIQAGQIATSEKISETIRILFATKLFSNIKILKNSNTLIIQVQECAIIKNITFSGKENTKIHIYTHFLPKNLVTLDIKIFENFGKRLYVHRIYFTGYESTREIVFRRELSQLEGDVLKISNVKNDINKINNLKYAEVIDIKIEDNVNIPNHYFIPISSFHHIAWMIRTYLGYTHGLNNKQVPFYDKFYTGGFETIRGFYHHTVGPKIINYNCNSASQCFNNPDMHPNIIGGNAIAVVNIELILPVTYAVEKIAIINLVNIFQKSPQQALAAKKLEIEFQDRATELDLIQKDLNAKIEILKRNAKNMDANARNALEEALNAQRENFSNKAKSFDHDQMQRQHEEQNKIIMQIKKI